MKTPILAIMESSRAFFHFIVPSILAIYIVSVSSESQEISMPLRCRTEGRVTLNFPRGESSFIHHLAFSESIDQVEGKSTISIGYPSHTPMKYYTRKSSNTISLDADGICKTSEEYVSFVPELSTFIERMLPGMDYKSFMLSNRHSVGPTGLTNLFILLVGRKLALTGRQTHRNIQCDVYTQTVRPTLVPGGEAHSFSIQVDIFIPVTGVEFSSMKNPIFCVKAKVTYDKPVTADGFLVQGANVVIDYFNIEAIDDSAGPISRMRDDFNFPLGKGCSQHLPHIIPKITVDSFSLVYQQGSTNKYNMMAYDHGGKFLRKETVGESVSIWDLNEDLLYHVSSNVSSILDKDSSESEFSTASCSVLKVVDNKLEPAYKPYEMLGESLDILKMLGIGTVAYMGRGMVRDMPCLIYEKMLPEAPYIFGLSNERLEKHNRMHKDYIVQFHLLEGQQKTDEKASTHLDEREFWPARIVLFRRYFISGQVEQVDQLDIYDFYWSLNGWNTKSNQLFMASDCFSDEDEQVRLELKLIFDRIHTGVMRDQDNRLLAFNKYKLEYDLADDLSKVLGMSKMHTIDYQLKLRPNHVNLELVIADRRENKELSFYGEGTLPNPKAYERNLVKLDGLSEESCILTSSHIEDVTLAIYCPHSLSCMAIFGESEPTIETRQDDSDGHKACYAYRFAATPAPQKGTTMLLENSGKLFGHPFNFEAKVPDSDRRETLKGSIQDYDLTHELQLLTISHYMFQVEEEGDKSVKHLDSIQYESLEDCERICNLDPTCKSYSYCSDHTEGFKCLLSQLDIRTSNVADQLAHSSFAESQKIKGGDKEYKIKFVDHCDIYERDYLSMFRQTDEVIRLKRDAANQFRAAPTTFDCAKISADLEGKSTQHHVTMFAYCPSTNANVCLLDENLFAPIKRQEAPSDDERSDQELLCRVYRKKYQTYFNVSGLVLKRPEEQSPQFKQIELMLNNVEQCAQACWVKFGHVCHSFDYCSPNSCLINHVGPGLAIDNNDMKNSKELEFRHGCLHYARDLKLDDLRNLHDIGRHVALQEPQSEGTGFGGIMVNMIICLLVAIAFVYGLVLGRQINDKMEAVTILRQSISLGSGMRASQMFHNFPGRSSSSNGDGVNALISKNRSTLESMDIDVDETNGIKMDVIRRSTGENRADEDED